MKMNNMTDLDAFLLTLILLVLIVVGFLNKNK